MIANPRVLVVDDEPVVIKSCDRVLSKEGIAVEGVTSARDGVELAGSNRFDAVLLDLKMPDMDGMEVLRRVKEANPAITVIIITGFPSVDTAVEALKLGAFDYVPKPFTPEEIAEKVKKALELHETVAGVEPSPAIEVEVEEEVSPTPEIKERPEPEAGVEDERMRLSPVQGRCIRVINRSREQIAILGLNGTFEEKSELFSAIRSSFKKAHAPITTEYGFHEVRGKGILPYLEDNDKVIIVAGVAMGKKPGTVLKFRATNGKGTEWTPRIELPQIGFPYLVDWAKAIGIVTDLVVIAVEPDNKKGAWWFGETAQNNVLTELWREVY